MLVSSSFSTQTSYANQTKKAITNKFIKECMTEFLKHNLEIYFIENPDEAVKIAEQVLVNKRSREKAEKSRIDLKKKLAGSIQIRCRNSLTAVQKTFLSVSFISWRVTRRSVL